ncbi:MAG: hypothetical protein L3J83_10690 [Proteobacteria bacterium]|nr:hypothetical protein [Pseudomonadota bacterium]
MIKITTLAILFFSNFALSKQGSKKFQDFQQAQDLLLAELSTTKEDLDKESLEWDRNFYQSLIEDDDPNIKLFGYSQKISGFKRLDNVNSLQDIATEINSMIFSDSLSHKSIATIANLCSYKKIEAFCDHGAIFERQDQSMPNNAAIYINRFSLAYNDSNQDEIKQIIKDMAQSTYIDIHMYLGEKFRAKLEGYVKKHPFSKSRLAMEKLYINTFSPSKLDESENMSGNMEDIMVFTVIIGTKLAESIPSFRSIIEECKNNPLHEKACLKISELFINKSKTIITALVGHAIKIEIFKQRENSTELEQAETNKAEYISRYECLVKIMNHGAQVYSKRGLEFNKTAESIERELGEVAYFESLAKLNYDYYAALGDEKVNNPENCGKKRLN